MSVPFWAIREGFKALLGVFTGVDAARHPEKYLSEADMADIVDQITEQKGFTDAYRCSKGHMCRLKKD